MSDQKFVDALRAFAKGFTLLADHYESLGDEPSISKAVKQQREVNEIRAGKELTEDRSRAGKVVTLDAKKAKAQAPDDEDDKEDTPAAPDDKAVARARKALADLDLDVATRAELKDIAEVLGVKTEGAKASELRLALKPIKESDGKPASKAGKGSKEKAVEFPDQKTMKKEFKVFCRANKESIEEDDPDFFDDDEDGDDPEKPRLHQILADDELLKANWKDNVWDAKQDGSWTQIVEAADGVVT